MDSVPPGQLGFSRYAPRGNTRENVVIHDIKIFKSFKIEMKLSLLYNG